mgnify:CR=1 FL=1
MNVERLISFLFSLCLHLGLLVLVLFWPAARPLPVEPFQGKFIPGIVTLGKSGKDVPGGKQAVPEAAKGRQEKAPPIEKPPADEPAKDVPKVEAPDKTVPKPDVRPIEKPAEKPVEKPVEKPAAKPDPDTVAIPKTPDKKPPKSANATKPATPAKTAQTPADKPKEPQKKPGGENLGSALADLNKQVGTPKGKTGGRGTAAGKGQDLSSALADLGKQVGSAGGADSGHGPGGSGGDGYGVLGAYQDSIVSRVRPNWSWPGRTDRKNYTAVVNIQIEPDGTIKNARIVTSSGNAYFDATVLQALAATTNLEPPPDPSYGDINIRFTPEGLGAR